MESGYCDAVENIDRAAFARLFIQGALCPRVKSDPLKSYLERFQLILSFLGDKEGILRENLTLAPGRFLLIPPPHQRYHVCTQFAEATKSLQLVYENIGPNLFLKKEIIHKGHRLLSSLGRGKDWIVIHPGSGSSKKNWPARHFATVARWLLRHHHLSLFLVKGEADKESIEEIQKALAPHFLPILTDLPLLTLAGVLSQCSVLLGNDSGVSHLAAAVGTPTVALFGPTRRLIWRPLGPHVRALRFEAVNPEKVGRILLSIREWRHSRRRTVDQGNLFLDDRRIFASRRIHPDRSLTSAHLF